MVSTTLVLIGIGILAISIFLGYVFFAWILPWITENVSEAWHEGKEETTEGEQETYQLNNGSLVLNPQSEVS